MASIDIIKKLGWNPGAGHGTWFLPASNTASVKVNIGANKVFRFRYGSYTMAMRCDNTDNTMYFRYGCPIAYSYNFAKDSFTASGTSIVITPDSNGQARMINPLTSVEVPIVIAPGVHSIYSTTDQTEIAISKSERLANGNIKLTLSKALRSPNIILKDNMFISDKSDKNLYAYEYSKALSAFVFLQENDTGITDANGCWHLCLDYEVFLGAIHFAGNQTNLF